MNWQERSPSMDPEGCPMCAGIIELHNDKREFLGSVMWFFDDGPFYAHAVDLSEPGVVRRIGPCGTLDGGKAAVEAVVVGEKNVSDRAGYPRRG